MSRMLGGEKLKGLTAPAAIRRVLETLLERGAVQAVLAPKQTPSGTMFTQALLTDPDLLDGVDPLAPVQMINAAHAVRELAKEALEARDGKIAAVLRPCEIRAVIELAKLKQIHTESLYLIGYDCPGVYDIPVYLNRVEEAGNADQVRGEALERFAGAEDEGLRGACRVCTYFTADSADLSFAWIGAEEDRLLVDVSNDRGERLAQELEDAVGLQEVGEVPGRSEQIEAVRKRRLKDQDGQQEDLLAELEACIRCYNCREVCPICYCKECLLVPAKMGYSSERYLRRAEKKGQIKMPVDTVLYHLTKMNHMSCSCVACGVCEQACPMDIPLGRIYSRVGRHVQALFDYVPGRSLEEQLPVTTFKEEELPQAEDIKG